MLVQPESKVTPHLCLPRNPLVFKEHCHGCCLNPSVDGNTVAPWILVSLVSEVFSLFLSAFCFIENSFLRSLLFFLEILFFLAMNGFLNQTSNYTFLPERFFRPEGNKNPAVFFSKSSHPFSVAGEYILVKGMPWEFKRSMKA